MTKKKPHQHGMCYSTFGRPQIDYGVIAAALEWYTRFGYKHVEVPWTVEPETDRITRPMQAEELPTQYGNLIGSAEQGFLQLAKEQRMEGRHVAVSPCFRVEKKFDEQHFPYFMKVELIYLAKKGDTDVELSFELGFMQSIAHCFFRERMTPLHWLETDAAAYDLMMMDIELGSYGIREYRFEGTSDPIRWVYGTGVAEPRFSYAKQHA